MDIKGLWRDFTQMLDRGGFPAWLAVTIFGWIIFWPLGLFMTIQMFMRRKNSMGCKRRRIGKTGNSAFDRYREETLKRLEEERNAFEDYLQKLRDARDQKEFDGFMKEQKNVQTV